MSVAHDDHDTDDPYDAYTVQPGDRPEWTDDLEELRESLLDLGRPMREVNRHLALKLNELRTSDQEATRARMTAEAIAAEVAYIDDPRLTRVYEIERQYPLMRWSSFRDTAPENVAWLVEGILAEGQQAFIGAPAKYGKTWVAGDLAVSVATGTPFLGRYAVRKAAPVLYLALEGQMSALRTRFGCLARGHGIDPDSKALDELYIRPRTPGIDLGDPAWADWITEQVRRTGAKLLIVDVLRKAMPKLKETGEGSTQFGELIANLARVAELGCAVEFLHHFAKRNESSKDRDVLELLVGSGAIGSHADNMLGIAKREKEGKLIRRLSVVCDGRDEATPEPFTIELHGEANGKHGGWCYTDTLTLTATTDERKRPRLDKRELKAIEIVGWIFEQPDHTASPAAIRDQFGLATDELANLRRDYMDANIEIEGAGPSTKYVARMAQSESL